MGQNILCYWLYADILVVKRSKHNAHSVMFELLECCEKEREIEKRQRKFAGYFKTQVTLSFSFFKSTWLLAINVFEFSNVRSAPLQFTSSYHLYNFHPFHNTRVHLSPAGFIDHAKWQLLEDFPFFASTSRDLIWR